mmetsp:Transcript_930/g.834  ORF Transcript_930/g.834 Transcript_930/m.834 type:complete len:85 (+) Transcript_930:685-939(+)
MVGGLLPCFDKCLFENDERIVVLCVKCYSKLVKLDKLRLKDMGVIKQIILPLVVHPNMWIREETINLICNVIERLDILELYNEF